MKCGSHQAITTKLKPLNTHSSNLITSIVLEVTGETRLHSEHCTWAFLWVDLKQFYVLVLVFTRGHVWHLHYTVTKRQLFSTYAFWLNVRHIYTENGNWLYVNYRRLKFIFGSQNDDQLLLPSHWRLSINQSHISWEKADSWLIPSYLSRSNPKLTCIWQLPFITESWAKCCQ